jgi:hypothetical protein
MIEHRRNESNLTRDAAMQLCGGAVVVRVLTLFDGEQHRIRDALVGPRQKQIDVHRSLNHNT